MIQVLWALAHRGRMFTTMDEVQRVEVVWVRKFSVGVVRVIRKYSLISCGIYSKEFYVPTQLKHEKIM